MFYCSYGRIFSQTTAEKSSKKLATLLPVVSTHRFPRFCLSISGLAYKMRDISLAKLTTSQSNTSYDQYILHPYTIHRFWNVINFETFSVL
jgi:hypothetical protein